LIRSAASEPDQRTANLDALLSKPIWQRRNELAGTREGTILDKFASLSAATVLIDGPPSLMVDAECIEPGTK
jgi:hypothetical protein